MRKQLKEFSIAMQKYGLAWSERYEQYVIPDYICMDKVEFNKFIRLISDTIEQYNRGESIVSQEELQREKTQSYYTEQCAVYYLQKFINWNLDRNMNHTVLDPAASDGRLVDGLNVSKDSIWLIEPDKKML